MKHGFGRYKWATGDTYEGEFVRDKRKGLGEYLWAEGGQYRGEWEGDRMMGTGWLLKEGIDVKGEFFNDHFVRPLLDGELTSPVLRSYLCGVRREE